MSSRVTISRPVGRHPASSGLPAATAPISTVVVAVPARDEAPTVRSCLRSIDRAARAAPDVDIIVVLAADRCRDDTALRARRVLAGCVRVEVIEGAWRGPGAARAAAVTAGLDECGAAPSAVWLASTDADCVVAEDWLTSQLAHAAAGRDATAGIVRLDPAAPARLRAEFAAAYEIGVVSHHHVHAANLGVRASAYRAVRGWSPHTVVGEEHNLWRRLRRAGCDVIQPIDVVVTTSARTHGRVIGGFASTLARLDAQSRAGVARSA